VSTDVGVHRRDVDEPTDERSDPKTRATDDDRKTPAVTNVANRGVCQVGVGDCVHFLVGIEDIEEVVRHASKLGQCRLGRPDVEAPVHLHAVGADELAIEVVRYFDGGSGLAAGGGSRDD